MRNFEFRLQRLLEWREEETKAEEGRLGLLLSELGQLDQRRQSLERTREEAEQMVRAAGSVGADLLAALDTYRLHCQVAKVKLTSQIQECMGRIEAQRAKVMEANRRWRLLGRLKQRRHMQWQAEADREQEALAAELYLARWNREALSSEQTPASNPAGSGSSDRAGREYPP